MLFSTCFRHHYAHNQELTTIALVQAGWMSVRTEGCRVTAFGPDTQPPCLHLTPNQQKLENQTAYVVTNAIIVSS